MAPVGARVGDEDAGRAIAEVSVGLGYAAVSDYLDAFVDEEGRADMADRFVAKANELGLTDVVVIYT